MSHDDITRKRARIHYSVCLGNSLRGMGNLVGPFCAKFLNNRYSLLHSVMSDATVTHM